MKIFLIVVLASCVGVGVGGGWSVMKPVEAAGGRQIVGVWFVTFPDAPFKYHM